MSISTFGPWGQRDRRRLAARRRESRRRYSASDVLSQRWGAMPAERESLRIYVDRAKAYRNECGCSMGGLFGAMALMMLIVYGFVYRGFSIEHWLLDTVVAAACLCGATLLGKLTGIGLARVRLVLLGRELRGRYSVQGN